jgi:hypothetical protein
VDVERFVPTLDDNGFLGVQGTRTPGPWRYNLGMWTSWSTNVLVVRTGREETDIIDHRVTTDLFFQLGIGGRLGLALDVPLVAFQDANADPLGVDGRAVSATAFGDPRLVARYRFYGENSIIERERNEGHGIAVLVASTLPLGQEDAFAGEGAVRTDVQALADFHVLGAGAGAMVGWRHRFGTRDLLGVRFRDEVSFGVALKLPIPVTRDLLGILEVRGATDAGSPFDESTTAFEGDLGVRIIRGGLSLTGGVGTGFTNGVGAPAFRAMLGLSWAPRMRDSDNDGIPDERDDCVHLPEDFDGFQDSDGCMDPDNDDDFIPDEDDECPNEPAEEGRDEDEDGCTDPIEDSDGDGVADTDDQCPQAAEDRDEYQDDDGCPEPDNDGDGVEDGDDACPQEPEDVDGHEDADGCADPDNDGDGVVDGDDDCPNAAEDIDEVEDTDGCPDPDNDRDGVVGDSDRCPTEPETINGVDDGDGCPDTGGRAFWRRTGQGDATRLVGVVRFVADHSIARTSAGSVAQLAQHLRAQWPHRQRIAIGSEAAERAAALRQALVTAGVDGGRVEIIADTSLTGVRVVVTQVVEEATSEPSGSPSE